MPLATASTKKPSELSASLMVSRMVSSSSTTRSRAGEAFAGEIAATGADRQRKLDLNQITPKSFGGSPGAPLSDSKELVEIIEIHRLEIASFHLAHQLFQLHPEATAGEQRQQ